jgi:hypothetical protein
MQRAFRMCVVEKYAHAEPRVENARKAVRSADLAQHRGRGIETPVDRAIGLPHRRARPAAHGRIGVVEAARRLAPREPLERLPQHLHGRFR